MFNNKDFQAIFIKIALASFVITLLIAAPYISKRASRKAVGTDDGKAIELIARQQNEGAVSESDDACSAVFKDGKASDKQLKPKFGSCPNELFPGNRPFSLDFHRMPLDYLVPQAPEVTRTSISRLKELQIADLGAIEAQQTMARNYDKTSPEDGSKR